LSSSRIPPIAFRVGTWLVLLGLYLAGAAHWVLFFNWGDISLKSHDWSKEHAYYLVLGNWLRGGPVPYHVAREPWREEPYRDFHGTDRFLGLPETNFSPQVLALLWLSPARFALFNVVVQYSAGFLGCLLLRRRYRLGLVPFAALFLLFSFNGYITARMGVGHSMWGGYFLLPFFCLLFLRWAEEGGSLRLALELALWMFLLMLQGSFHLAVWCWMFLLFFAAFNPRQGRWAAVAFLFSGLLCVFRLVPAAVTFWGSKIYPYMGGYPDLYVLLDALITIRPQEYPDVPGLSSEGVRLGWWEYDVYVGLLGLAVLFGFGVYLRFRKDPALVGCRFPGLDGPMLLLFFLSLDYFYAPVPKLPLPLANGERVVTRFIIVPLVLLMVLAAIRMQRVLGKMPRSPALGLLLVGGLLEIAFCLAQHSYAWRLARFETEWAHYELDTNPAVVSRPDDLYVASVQGSAAVSLVALLAWVALYGWSRRRAAASGGPVPKVLTAG
jgi:hypothetical protein